SVLVSAISIRGALIVAALGISTLLGSTPAKAILGVTVASGSLTGVGRTAASLEDEGVFLIISCSPMADPQCGGELDPMAGSTPLPLRLFPRWRRTPRGPRALRSPNSEHQQAE